MIFWRIFVSLYYTYFRDRRVQAHAYKYNSPQPEQRPLIQCPVFFTKILRKVFIQQHCSGRQRFITSSQKGRYFELLQFMFFHPLSPESLLVLSSPISDWTSWYTGPVFLLCIRRAICLHWRLSLSHRVNSEYHQLKTDNERFLPTVQFTIQNYIIWCYITNTVTTTSTNLRQFETSRFP